MKKLSELEAGEAGIIHSFEKDELYIKLLEMGCVPGEPVKVVQVAPLGDPISIEVSGYHLSLRLSEADSIIVSQKYNLHNLLIFNTLDENRFIFWIF